MAQNILKDKRLVSITFPESQEFDARIAARLSAGRALKNCYRIFGDDDIRAYYAVRLGLGSRQWELGRHHNRTVAVRFADMAIVYFWKYRPSRLLPPTDADVNLTVEQATRDLAEIHEARELLDLWAKGLQDKGVIRPPVEILSKYNYNDTRDIIWRNVQALGIGIKTMRENHPDLNVHFDVLESQMDSLRKTIRSIDRVLCERPS